MHRLGSITVVAALACMASTAFAEGGYENHFASVLVDGKKMGNVHYTVKTNDQGELEELRTKVSLSLLGVKLYDFAQQLHEQWSKGDLQTMWGNTNDDGKVDEVNLERTATEYDATLNGKSLVLPHDAFPISLWHYAVSQQSLLFDLSNLKLLKVQVSGGRETIDWNGGKVDTERFDFTGDWKGSVWFDQDRQFIKAQYTSNKRLVTVLLDP